MQRRADVFYRAVFSGLKLKAFGIDQILNGTFTIDIHQGTANPQWWKATPLLARNDHKWEGPSPETVMRLVAEDFEACVTPWETWPLSEAQPRPTLGDPPRKQPWRRRAAVPLIHVSKRHA